MNEFLCENLKKVEDNIAAACQKAGRDRSEVTLIAVSKTKPVDMLQTVYDQNIREFGENKVQEMCEKMEILPKDIHWHMIGHLQTNKVKYIVGKTALIHSVDSLHLAKEIEKQLHHMLKILRTIAHTLRGFGNYLLTSNRKT